jgi:hypothetical protein
MYVNPSTITATAGETFIINVNISEVIDLYGWEFKLKWNSSVLDALNVTEGEFLNSSGDTYFQSIINNTLGCILVDCTLIGAIPGVNGSGRLASVEFRVEEAEESILDLNDTKLVNSSVESITHQTLDGNFTSTHDVAVTNIIASPLRVIAGQKVEINVTAGNEGAFHEDFNVTVYYDSEIIEVKLLSLDIGQYVLLNFAWNTTGVPAGDYFISAEASIVLNETDTTDNTKVTNNKVTVLSSGHDIAIQNVNPSKTVVGQSFPVNVSITIKNYGSFTETFNVTACYNQTAITLPDGKNYSTIILNSENSSTLTLTWNTTTVAKGNYTLSAHATPVQNETRTTNNNLTDGYIILAMIGDVYGPDGWPDGKVDMRDVAAEANLFGVTNIDPRYIVNRDITGHIRGVPDGKIDMRDIAVPARNFGKIDP